MFGNFELESLDGKLLHEESLWLLRSNLKPLREFQLQEHSNRHCWANCGNRQFHQIRAHRAHRNEFILSK